MSRRSPATAGRRRTFLSWQRECGELRLGMPNKKWHVLRTFTFYKARLSRAGSTRAARVISESD